MFLFFTRKVKLELKKFQNMRVVTKRCVFSFGLFICSHSVAVVVLISILVEACLAENKECNAVNFANKE